MPYISGSNWYGSFNILSAFDFLPVEKETEKYFIRTIKDAPVGSCNISTLFSNRTMTVIVKPSELYAKQGNGAVTRLGEILLYTTGSNELSSASEKLLKQTSEKGVRFNVKKRIIVRDKIEWCGSNTGFKAELSTLFTDASTDYWSFIIMHNERKNVGRMY